MSLLVYSTYKNEELFMIAAHIYIIIRSGASDAHIICASDVLSINDEEFWRSNPFFY